MERKVKKAKKVMVQNLPDDMIVEIFLRLPNKSLFRFRCVCKSWSALLCPHINQKLLLLFKEHCSIFVCNSATSDSNASAVKVETIKFEDSPILSLVLANASIVASCDNYFLLYSDDLNRREKLCLFNPSTKEYKFFKEHPTSCSAYNQCFGICYDFSVNDYKVVLVTKKGNDRTLQSSLHSHLYSFETNSWTSTRFLPNSVGCIQSYNVPLNGASHWVCFRRDRYYYGILRFALKDGFEQMSPPRSFSDHLFLLAALRGNLCAYYYRPTGFLVWEMKQYGVAESWTQVYNINIQAGYLRPLAFIRKSEMIIATTEKGLVIYNVEDNSSTSIMRFEEYRELKMATYADRSITFNCDSCCNKGSIPTTEHFEDDKEE